MKPTAKATMKKKKYLPLYYKWMKAKRLPGTGLCGCLGFDDELLAMFRPDYAAGGYWGYYLDFFNETVLTQDVSEYMANKLMYKFNPLRQNIVLLMAAINGEL